MRRTFALNVAFLFGINLLIKPYYIFFIDRVIQNEVGAASYGLYFAIFNFTLLFQIINDFGLQNYNARNIAQHQQLLDKYFPNLLGVKVGLSVLYGITTLVFGLLSGYGDALWPIFILVMVNQMLVSLIFFLRSNIVGLAMYRLDSVLSGMDKFLLILICGFLLNSPYIQTGFKIEWLVYAQTGALFLTALTAFLIVYRKLKVKRLRLNIPIAKVLLKRSFPFAIAIFLAGIFSRVDGVMIERILDNGAWHSGVYASAFRLLDAGNMAGFLFVGLFLPMISRQFKEGQSIVPLAQFSLKLMGAGVIALSAATVLFRVEIMNALYTEANAYYHIILGLLMVGLIASNFIHIIGAILMAIDRIGQINRVYVIGALVNVLLNVWAIWYYQATGAAFVTIITQFLVLIALIIAAQREVKGLFTWQLIAKLLGYAVLMFGLSSIIYNFVPLPWGLNFLLALVAGIPVSFATGLLSLQSLASLPFFKRNTN